MGDGKYGEALSWYDKANRANLTEGNFYNYGFAAYVLQEYAKALDIVQSGIQKFPGSEYISRVGMMAATSKELYTDALNYANTLFAGKSKKVANDYLVYAKALAGNKQFDQAYQAIDKAKELDPNNISAIKALADVYVLHGNEDKALEVQQEYLQKNPNANSADFASLASTYVQKAEKLTGEEKKAILTKAMNVYESMIEKFPSISDWIWLNQANVANMLNDPDKVAEIYQKVVEFEEAKPSLNADQKSYLENVYYGLGYYNSKKGNEEVAKEYYNKVLKVNPDNEYAKKALGM